MVVFCQTPALPSFDVYWYGWGRGYPEVNHIHIGVERLF